MIEQSLSLTLTEPLREKLDPERVNRPPPRVAEEEKFNKLIAGGM
jgi:hypothetical protein